jgi:cytochrome P450 / NADPH-cytochrome P450 reductase
MHDLAKQLALSWGRRGPDYRINAPADFTKLTLDTIALCAMDYRFNSFYQEEQHPFVQAMITALTDRSNRGSRLPLASLFMTKHAAEVEAANALLLQTAQTIVEERRKNPSDRKDLLNAMINNTDPKTGEKMTDILISANMITFLIAGTLHHTIVALLH